MRFSCDQRLEVVSQSVSQSIGRLLICRQLICRQSIDRLLICRQLICRQSICRQLICRQSVNLSVSRALYIGKGSQALHKVRYHGHFILVKGHRHFIKVCIMGTLYW